MKNKNKESQLVNQHELLESTKAITDSSIGKLIQKDITLEEVIACVEKNEREWSEGWATEMEAYIAKSKFYEARRDEEIKALIIESMSENGEYWPESRIEEITHFLPFEFKTVTFTTIDGEYAYQVSAEYARDIIRQVRLEKAKQERAIIENELCTSTKTTIRSRSI
jgi:hypothetical protein